MVIDRSQKCMCHEVITGCLVEEIKSMDNLAEAYL